MPNTGLLMLGALGLLYFMRTNGSERGTTGSLASLLNADMSSSGQGSFGGNEANLLPPVMPAGVTAAVLSGNQSVTAMVVEATGSIPAPAADLQPESSEIAGTLNALFDVQGVTVSELSGNAVRQVGLLSPYESTISESNYPQIEFVDLSVDGQHGSPLEVDDEPIEVLPAKSGTPLVLTISGNDQTTPVTTGINRSTDSYFTSTSTILEAVNQGYFDSPAPYEARTVLEIEESWKMTPAGQAQQQEAREAIQDAYDLVFSLNNEVTTTQMTGGRGTGYGIDIFGDEG